MWKTCSRTAGLFSQVQPLFPVRLLILNGPNLNLLGTRERDIYGLASLDEIEKGLRSGFPNVDFRFLQDNREGVLVDALQEAEANKMDGVVFNPGGYAHTSVALRDTVAAIETPVVEVHISNVYAREDFRRHSYISPVVVGQICGFGVESYRLALHAAAALTARK